jgi:2-C-methyl-D-erythritol 4-phosphate cytidylyltransferase/2-C-methyl-D-erythritol 2,4-cyclodiphosphate synthase
MNKTVNKIDDSSLPVPFHALIVAAGRGSRLGGEIPKQYQNLNGKPLVRHSIEAFQSTPGLRSLTVVIAPEHAALYERAVGGLDLPEPVHGGAERNESVYRGLQALSHIRNDDIVLVHDAARPFIEPRHIMQVAAGAARHYAATLAAPVSDTLRRADGAYVDRKGLWSVQTPQGFHYGILRRAHEAAPAMAVTDDTGLVAALGHDVKMVEGSRRNMKITTADDMMLAEQMMNIPMETRTGTGYDVHAFGKTKTGTVRLCGLDIPHDFPLDGHSDADVGLHALTDALLGALALGDIGLHFPPSDPQWKGAASDRFLQHAVKLVQDKGARIVHLDLTLICEAPKIGPHREAMQTKIAEICGLSPGRVSVKATTTEQLGFTGRREGIAAQAAATIEVPRA